MFGGPPEHSAIGNIHRDIFVIGYHYITTCHSKQLLVGLMALSYGMVHFLKIEKNFNKSTKTILLLLIITWISSIFVILKSQFQRLGS